MRASLEVADIFRAAGPAYRATHAGHLSLQQFKVMAAIEACRTAALGGHVEGCEDCLREGGVWLHLRICLTCGHVGCCDDSPNRHATAHHHATTHPIIRSLEPGEDWSWCYADEVALLIEGISGETRIPPSPLLQ